MAVAPTFYVVPGSAVKSAIEANRQEVFDAVERAYRLHAARDAINPDSYFLRFPDKPSATRTAASAALAAEHISPNPFEGALSIVGTGVIARAIVEWLLFRNWTFRKVILYDLDRNEAERFSAWLRNQHNLVAEVQDNPADALREASLTIFCDLAGT